MPASPLRRPLSQLLDGLQAELRSLDPQLSYLELRDDSREVQPGDIYLATPGAQHDGHSFVLEAAQRGAAALIVQADALPHFLEQWGERPLIVLDDTLAARAQLAGNHFGWPDRALSLVGITGTNGKTTVTHLLSGIWQALQIPSARLGTTDNRIATQRYPARFTTPFPVELQSWLARAREAKVQTVALEVSSHAMAQGRVDGLQFRAVALTSFSQDHLDFHPTMADYLQAKCMLATRLSPEGLAVAPLQTGPAELKASHHFLTAAREQGARSLTFSLDPNPQAQLYCESWQQDRQGLRAQVQSPWGPFAIQSPLVGAFNLENLLCASAIALDLGVKTEELAACLPSCKGAPGRLERVLVPEPDAYPAVYVDYAHTPDAVARASACLQDQHPGKLITVLGCGGDRDRAKRPKMARAALEHSDFVIFSSDNPRSEDPEAILDDMTAGLPGGAWTRMSDRAAAIAQAIQDARPEDRVLIAGKGHENYQIIGSSRLPFDDRAVAKSALLKSRS